MILSEEKQGIDDDVPYDSDDVVSTPCLMYLYICMYKTGDVPDGIKFKDLISCFR